MRKLALSSSIGALALLAASTASATTVIDFDALSGSFTSMTISGVTFSPNGPGPISFLGTPNGTTGILAVDSPHSTIKAKVAGGTDFVSIDLGDFSADPDLLFLQAFDAADVLLGSTQLLTTNTDGSMHTLSLSIAGIDHASFGSTTPSLNGSSVYADNFTFNGSSGAPEPASWALMLTGFLGLGAMLRARPRRASANA